MGNLHMLMEDGYYIKTMEEFQIFFDTKISLSFDSISMNFLKYCCIIATDFCSYIILRHHFSEGEELPKFKIDLTYKNE